MSYSYRILDVAAVELLEASLWYESKRAGLGDEFMLCFEAELNHILKNPFQFQIQRKNLRFAIFDRFPYYIIYYVEENLVTVIACFHSKRNPGVWKKRRLI